MTDPENELRRMLAQQAGDAPDGAPIAERVLAEIAAQPAAKRGWQRWGIPVAAAAVVAAVTAGTLGLTALHRHDVSDNRGLGQTQHTPRSHTPTLIPRQTSAGGTSAENKGSDESSSGTEVRTLPTGFVATDLSFDSEASGWVIGSTGCGTAACAYLGHSTTVGGGWAQIAQLPLPVAVGPTATCSHAPCVDHVRFYDDLHGYLYGPSAFYTTSDGGQTWSAQDNQGAAALEVDSLAAVRVTTTGGCRAGCTFRVQTAKPGSATWVERSLGAAPVVGSAATIARAHDTVYLAVAGPTGADRLFVSKDRGVQWSQQHRDPCESQKTGSHLADVATDQGGADLVVLCVTAAGQSTLRVGDAAGGALSTLGAVVGTGSTTSPRVAILANSTVVVAGDALYRGTTAGGAGFTPVPDVKASTGVCFLGFENATMGRFVGADGRTVWTTRDAGKTWSPVSFS